MHPMKTHPFLTKITASVLLLIVSSGSLLAQPYCGGGWNRYTPRCYQPCANRGGWYGTGVPNGLAWTLLGIGAAGAIAGTARAIAPAPVYFQQPTYVQQPVYVQQSAPVVMCNGIPCYYINGNFYPVAAR